MGLGGAEGPPKKKLKQAQLNFCVSTEKASNKRKLSDSSDGLATKLFRTDPGTPKTPVFNKENIVVNTVDKSSDVQKTVEPKIDVTIVLDDDSKEGKPERGLTEDKAIKEAVINKNVVEIDDDDVSQGSKSKDGDLKLLTEPTQSPAKDKREATTRTKTEALMSDSVSKDEAESTCSKAESDQLVTNEVETKDLGKLANSEPEKYHDDSKLDKSADSEQGDVNTSVYLSSEDEQVSSPNMKTTPTRKIIATPKSSTKKLERERQREEKLRLKREKEEQKRKEKEEKEKKRQEELRLKEEEKKRKEDERKRKEEERKRKEEERKKKEEAKEEERRKKEEERKKKEEMKEEDRRKKEEVRLAEERKENLAKAAFTKFFITEKSKPSLLKNDEMEAQTEKTERPKFMPFPVKSDMRLAMQVRHTLTKEEKDVLRQALTTGHPSGNTYLKELKNGRKPKTSPATWPLSDEQHDVIIVESVDDDKADIEQEAKLKVKTKGQKAKLLYFHENRRPPYWGTWRKPSKAVGPRRPFGQDKILDYEVDSDSEWEDEEEGEDIDKEDGDSDKEEADDENVGENGYMLDNTFVPHGYLSDEEAAEAEDDDSVEDQKLKLTVLKQEFDQELKSKTQRLKPRLLGCVNISNITLEASKSIYQQLMKLRCKYDDELTDVTSPAMIECSPSPSVSNAKFPSSMVGQLAKLIHGNRSSMKALISEFMNSCEKDTQLSAVSKRAVFLKVKEIAAKTFSTGSGRLVWAVNPDLCNEFGLEPIVDPPKTVPAVSPVVESPKPKDSPLANYLKKTSTPQGPVKRLATTMIPRDGPSETPSSRGRGAVHIDTPRPKFTPQMGNLATHPDKPIRRVATTLLSSVAGPVKNKTYNVCEIDKPGRSPLSTLPKTTSIPSTTVDLTDSNDGITPLPDEINSPVPSILAACNLSKSPVQETSDLADTTVAVCDSTVHLSVPESGGTANPPQASVKEGTNPLAPHSVDPTPAGSADPPSKAFEPNPMETESPTSASDAGCPSAQTAELHGPQTMDVGNKTQDGTGTEPSAMETDDPLEPRTDATLPTVSNHAKPSTVSSTAKPLTVEAPKSVPSTPTPVRKRVPLITLSKAVSKPRNAKSPGQNISIADMFSRKPAKKDTPSKPGSLEPPAVIDLSND